MSGPTYQFSVDDAIKWKSSDIASILQNIRFWLAKNKANRHNIHDGRVWTYNTFEAWSELFPWLSVPQLKRLLKKLEEGGLLVKGNYNKDKFLKTVWYSLDEPEFLVDEAESPERPIVRNRTIDNSGSYEESTESYDVTDNKQQIINSKLVNSSEIFTQKVMRELIQDEIPGNQKRYAKLKVREFQERWPDSKSVADAWSYVVTAVNHRAGLTGETE